MCVFSLITNFPWGRDKGKFPEIGGENENEK